MPHDDQRFTPEGVEEQIGWLERASRVRPPSPNARVITDLKRLYENERADVRSVAAGWQRLQERGAVPAQEREHARRSRPPARRQESRPVTLASPPAPPVRRGLSMRLLALAAAVLLVVVVSGLVAGLVLVRHPTSSSHPTTTPGGAAATATPPPTQGALYAVSSGNTVVALDPLTGSVRWQHPFTVPPDFILSIKAIEDQTVYVDTFIDTSKLSYQGQPNTLTALDAEDGTQRWQTADYRSYTISGGVVLASHTTLSALSALDGHTGNTLWTFQSPQGTILGGGIVTSDTVYSGGDDTRQNDFVIYAINANNGTERWHLSNPNVVPLQAATNDTVYAVFQPPSGGPPILSALNASDGTERWHFQAVEGDYGWSIAVLNGVVYASASGDDRGGTGQGVLYTLNASDGKELWHTPPAQDSRSLSIPVVSQGVVYISDGAGVYAFDAARGQQLWDTRLGGWSGNEPPVVQDGLLYLNWYNTSSTSGRTPLILSVLDVRTGTERWHITVSDGPTYSPEVGPPPSPFVANGIVFVSTTDGVQALRGSDSTQLWQQNALTSLMVATD